MTVTAAVYIDGLNLYYGLAKELGCKWVDLQSYFEQHFPHDSIERIYFCEAKVVGPKVLNQEAYISALQTLPKVEVILGTMKAKQGRCKVVGCGHGIRTWQDYEEKYTDVSLGIQIVNDTHLACFEKLILVTADTDLMPAVRMAKEIRPQQQVVLCIPGLHQKRIWGAKPIADVADKATRANAELFVRCQFPAAVQDSHGRSICRPAAWREAPKSAVQDWIRSHSGVWLDPLPKWCR